MRAVQWMLKNPPNLMTFNVTQGLKNWLLAGIQLIESTHRKLSWNFPQLLSLLESDLRFEALIGHERILFAGWKLVSGQNK